MDSSHPLHIAMFPWFAMGHQTAFLHLSNKLAKKGHKITFFTPQKAESKLKPFNLHPESITFITITVPHVDPLPPNSQTTADVPYPLQPHIMTAMDLTRPDIESHLLNLKPHIVFYDFTHWIPSVTKALGIKCLHYCTASSVMVGYTLSPARYSKGKDLTEFDLMEPPPGYPDSSIKLFQHEAKSFAAKRTEYFGSNVLFYDRQSIALNEADALGYRTCREIEGPYLDYIQKVFNKPVLASGPVILEKPNSCLEEKGTYGFNRFEKNSVVYCCFGSECTLKPDQFTELVLGLELTGKPFFAALKPPFGFATVEEALPEGFKKRVAGKGAVFGGWVQQQLILEHSSIGCFITHCGSGSLSEALVNKCQLVLLPNVGDQILNARMMGNNLKVGVEVVKDENGFFTKESVCEAVKIVMDDENEISKEVRGNHAKIREMLLNKDLESSYIDTFCKKLQEIVQEIINGVFM
ncbi:UDP-glycosyltransferase 79B30 [Cicer arietinum]|uniref:Glycosyltransferase n=1 Tax=Cicer arietinum TaxID=3827 RepID=A0A067XU10_CICAR|nr:UDP-glycosyltransferase 79B30 [Cicer arietinum]AGU14090.1 UDP-glycosyltransferase [Cicer arietinum]